jgi:hypothetical protein
MMFIGGTLNIQLEPGRHYGFRDITLLAAGPASDRHLVVAALFI